CQQHYTSPPTF
nr:immunoglobulin light chain junction region [Macaca mulatta]